MSYLMVRRKDKAINGEIILVPLMLENESMQNMHFDLIIHKANDLIASSGESGNTSTQMQSW